MGGAHYSPHFTDKTETTALTSKVSCPRSRRFRSPPSNGWALLSLVGMTSQRPEPGAQRRSAEDSSTPGQEMPGPPCGWVVIFEMVPSLVRFQKWAKRDPRKSHTPGAQQGLVELNTSGPWRPSSVAFLKICSSDCLLPIHLSCL